MQLGDYAAEFLESNGIAFELLPTKTFAEAVEKVIDGEADAVIGDKQIVLYHLFSNNLTELIKSVGEPLYTGQNSIGMIEGATELTGILNKDWPLLVNGAFLIRLPGNGLVPIMQIHFPGTIDIATSSLSQ